MSSTNLPATKRGKNDLVNPADAAAELDIMITALPDLESEDLMERTLARTLNATEVVDIFANPELEGFLNLIDHDLVLRDVLGHLPSRYVDGQRYLVYDVLDESTGEHLTVASGSPYVASSALRAKALGKLPVECRALALDSRDKPGQQSLWLVARRRGGNRRPAYQPPEARETPMVNDQVKFPYAEQPAQ
jgi:hypothetical protein